MLPVLGGIHISFAYNIISYYSSRCNFTLEHVSLTPAEKRNIHMNKKCLLFIKDNSNINKITFLSVAHNKTSRQESILRLNCGWVGQVVTFVLHTIYGVSHCDDLPHTSCKCPVTQTLMLKSRKLIK